MERNSATTVIKVVQQQSFTNAKMMSLHKFHWLESSNVT